MSGVITPSHSTSLSTSQTLPQIPNSSSNSPTTQPTTQSITQSHASLLSSENVWHALLSGSQRLKSRYQASTLIVLGDKLSGKNALLNHFRDRQSVNQSHTSINASPNDSLLSYSFINVKDWSSADVDDVLTVQHVWSLDSVDHIEVLASVLTRGLNAQQIADMYATCFALIVVDAANLSNVESQTVKWSSALAKLRDLMFSSLNQTQRHTLLHNQSMHVQSYYNSELHLTPEEVKADVPEINYGMPLLMAVTHVDALSKSSFPSTWPVDDRLECVAYVCRRFALQHGAALAFTSFTQPSSHSINQSANPAAQQKSIFLSIQSYIYHRVYGFSLSPTPPKAIAVAEDADLWIPAGFDSSDLIESAQTKPGRFTERTRLAEMLTPAAKSGSLKTRGSSNSNNGTVKAHDNGSFLKLMQASLEKSGGPPITDLASPVLAALSSAGKSSSKPKSYDSANSSDSGSGPSSATASPRRSHHASSASLGGSTSKTNPKGGQVAVKAFFKSLLQQPPAGSAGATNSGSSDATHTKRPSISSSAVRKDAEKELKRMSEAQSQQSSQSP